MQACTGIDEPVGTNPLKISRVSSWCWALDVQEQEGLASDIHHTFPMQKQYSWNPVVLLGLLTNISL